jgi:hypothetical protein
MKGFLQRIAATAIRPEPRLKPLVGSIFTGEPGMDVAEEKPSLLVDPPRGIRSPSPSQPAPEQIETRITHAPEPSRRETPVHDETSIAMPQPSPPSLASVVSQLTLPKRTVVAHNPDAPERDGFKETVTASGASTALPVQHFGRTEEHSHALATIPAASRPLQPSDRHIAQGMLAGTRRELPQPAPSTEKKSIPQLAPRQTATQASTREEIQIHIGRIEVITVPPPATAAPATSRSRATSLDDYLRRRNGTAG